jgi:NADH:ubiquinone oxidoreductase subunit 3 (subunit A)
MGSFEVFHYWLLINVLVVLIIALLSVFSFKNLLNRFGLLRVNRREFYECGFKPQVQKPVKLALQFILVCIFFIIYDIELVFSYPLISYLANHSILESFVFGFLYGTFVLSLVYDFERLLTKWRI